VWDIINGKCVKNTVGKVIRNEEKNISQDAGAHFVMS